MQARMLNRFSLCAVLGSVVCLCILAPLCKMVFIEFSAQEIQGLEVEPDNVFYVRQNEKVHLARDADAFGFPGVRDFKLRIDGLEYSIGRVYALVSLHYEGKAGFCCDGFEFLEFARCPSRWNRPPIYLFSVNNIPEPFEKSKHYIDTLWPLREPKPCFCTENAVFGHFQAREGNSFQRDKILLVWRVEITNNLDLGKVSRDFDELAIRRGEIQLRCLVSYRWGNKVQTGLVSTPRPICL